MQRRQKRANDVRTFTFDFSRALEDVWQPGVAYLLTEYTRPSVPNGFEYECTDAGQSAQDEPDWPSTIGNTIDDGSVEWTCRDFASNASDTVSTEAVTVPTGLTLDAESVVGDYKVSATLSGGTVGQSYDVLIEATTNTGEVLSEILRLTIVE